MAKSRPPLVLGMESQGSWLTVSTAAGELGSQVRACIRQSRARLAPRARTEKTEPLLQAEGTLLK